MCVGFTYNKFKMPQIEIGKEANGPSNLKLLKFYYFALGCLYFLLAILYYLIQIFSLWY